MNQHEPLPELQFDKNRSRVKLCPCGKDNKDVKFAPYVGFENKGYCFACCETFLPELPNGNTPERVYQTGTLAKPVRKPVTYIPNDVFQETLGHYEANNLVIFLTSFFGPDIAKGLVERYFIGTSKHCQNATVFPQIDLKGRVRTGKIMQYNPDTGKRSNYINWLHTAPKQPDFNLKQCFFGEHFLKDNTKPVAIVESEKTALFASVYLPDFIWLATSGKAGLTASKCKVLQGRKVILYPDLSKPDAKINCFEYWTKKAKELSYITDFTVSDLLECKATEAEREQGLDIADYLIKFDFKDIKQPIPNGVPQGNTMTKVTPVPKGPITVVKEFNTFNTFKKAVTIVNELNTLTAYTHEQPETWTTEVNALDQFFKTTTLPEYPVMLNKCTEVLDVSKCIESNLAYVRANDGKRTFLPYLDCLRGLRLLLESKPVPIL